MVNKELLLKKLVSQDLKNELKKVSPVRDGFLRKSIDVVPTSKGVRISMLDYGEPLEFSTSKRRIVKILKGGQLVNHEIKPRPFIRPLLYSKLPGIVAKRRAEVYG